MLSFDREQLIFEVKGWITETGFTFDSSPYSKFSFVINFFESKNFPQVQLVHQKPTDAYFLLISRVNIPKSDRDLLKRSDLGRFKELIWDLKLNLLLMGVDFTVFGPDEFDPDAWEVQARLFIKEAGARDFYETCSKVKRALISIIWGYKRALNVFL